MPTIPPAAKVIKVVFETPVTAHEETLWRFFIQYANTAPTAAQLNTFAAACNTAWNTNLASLFSTNTQSDGVQAIDLSSGGAQGQDTTVHAGTRAGTEAPIQCALVINFQIARRYRGGKPKLFMNAGVQGDFADVRTWSAGFVTAATTGWGNFMTAVLAAGWVGSGALQQVNVSYYSGFTTVTRLPFRARNVPTLRATPLQDPITTFSVASQVGSQRRRRLS